MGRRTRLVIALNPNSEYHRILVKNLGVKGALNALRSCNLAYNIDMVSYKTIIKYGKDRLSTKGKAFATV